MPSNTQSGKAKGSNVRWRDFQEVVLMDVIGTSGMFVSKTGPAQMETNDAKWSRLLDAFAISVAAANATVITAQEDATQKYSEDLLKWQTCKGKRGRQPKKPEVKPVKGEFTVKMLQDKWGSLGSRYKEVVAQCGVRNYQLRGESGAGSDASMDSKLAAAAEAWPHFQAFHESFGTLERFNPNNIVESVTGAAAHMSSSCSMRIAVHTLL